MAITASSIPMRWPSGPLEIARRQKSDRLTPVAREALEGWHRPRTLDLLTGTPFDCLVVNWSAGFPEDLEQQDTIVPLIEAARKRGLDVVGWVEGAADHAAAVGAAKSAGLSAIAIRDYRGAPDPLIIPWGDRANPPWDSAGAVLPVTGNVWPGVEAGSGSADADAGPTGLPWLDSNGWYVQLARARVGTPVWLMFDPPGGTVVRAQDYALAVCDAEVPGGKWVVSLDDDLRAGLAAGDSSARETWQTITDTITFFQQHKEWASYRSVGVLGVISDFAGENNFLNSEILNLMARRDLLFRVIWKSQALAAPFAGLKALVYVDVDLPAPALREKVMSFIDQGGLLITGPGWESEGNPVDLGFNTQFNVHAHGNGRVAVAKQELSDPWQFAVDTQFLLSHRNDLVKIYNSSSSGCTSFTASSEGTKAVLQGLSYASGRGRGGLRTIWIRDEYRTARLWLVGAEPVSINPEPSEEYFGWEYHLPETADQSHFALEFEV